MRYMRKQYAVFGLGSFGRSVALTLESLGCDVVAVDKSYEKVQEISDSVTYALRADVSDPDALLSLGGRNLDGAVVAVSDSLEASIIATITAKEIGIPYVLVKARDELQGTVLEKVGADSVVYPERDMGSRVAKNLVSATFADWIELSSEYSLAETAIPEKWVGQSLAELRVRERYGINVVGVMQHGEVNVNIDPCQPLTEECIIIVIASNAVLSHFLMKNK